MRVVILRGIPASGKSTYAYKFLRNNPSTIRTNMDSLRVMFKGVASPFFATETLVKRTEINIIQDALAHNMDVLIDDTNITLKRIKYLLLKIKKYSPIVEVVTLTIPADVDARNGNRDARVPIACMNTMKKNYNKNDIPVSNFLKKQGIKHTKI